MSAKAVGRLRRKTSRGLQIRSVHGVGERRVLRRKDAAVVWPEIRGGGDGGDMVKVWSGLVWWGRVAGSIQN